MHEQPKRQLFSACNGALLVLAGLVFSITHADGADASLKSRSLAEEIKAARLTEHAVMAGLAGNGKEAPTAGDLEKISRVYKDIIERNPKSADAWNADAEFLWSIQRHSEAMAEWLTAEMLGPGNAVVKNHLGEGNIELGHAKKATEYFEQATKLDPKNALYQFYAGNTNFLFRHEMTDDANNEQSIILRAVAHFRVATQIEPFNIDYALAYAETFYALQPPDWNSALQAWLHYSEITDLKDFAYSNLARVNLKLGNKIEARDNLVKIQSGKIDGLKKHLMLEAGTE